MFFSGLTLTIGPQKTLKFFLRQKNHKASGWTASSSEGGGRGRMTEPHPPFGRVLRRFC